MSDTPAEIRADNTAIIQHGPKVARPPHASVDDLVATVLEIRSLNEEIERRVAECKRRVAALTPRLERAALTLGEITDQNTQHAAVAYAYWMLPEVGATTLCVALTGAKPTGNKGQVRVRDGRVVRVQVHPVQLPPASNQIIVGRQPPQWMRRQPHLF